jgi:hypothetical protein
MMALHGFFETFSSDPHRRRARPMVFTTDERLDDPVQPWKEGHAARAEAKRPFQVAIAAMVLG